MTTSPPRSYPKLATVIILAVIVIGASTLVILWSSLPPTGETLQTSSNFTFTTDFYYSISINYSGSWNLVYTGQDGSSAATMHNVTGNLNGSGNYETTKSTYGVGYVESTFCAKATKLDSSNLTLTLTVSFATNSITASNPSVEVCATFGV